ncbi:hypothetical protein BJF90_24540 [Pseudonocardia sp. CNS-004]|nr:hypothetical protein BJF90_24540 [Pseudonocardia sp. CNS-004]
MGITTEYRGGVDGRPRRGGTPYVDETTGTDTATLTHIGAAIAAGDPKWRHTRVTDPETAERVLLNVALCGTASHIETVVTAVRRLHTPPPDTAARRSMTWRTDDDGSLLVRVRLTPDAGAAFIAAIEGLVPPKIPPRYSDAPAPADLDERAREQEPGPVIDRMAARRADALLALVTRTRTASTGTGTGASTADDGDARGGEAAPVVERGTTQLVVHLDVNSGTARITGGPEIPASTAERLACDARVQLLLDDREGNRMYLGRSRRLATPAQITALAARDGERCQFPGCTHTHYLQAHHVRHWLHGGRTDIDNLVLICSFHHTTIHDHGYRIRRRPELWEFLRPDGTPIPEPVVLNGNTEGLIEMHTWDRLRIDRTTLSPQWYGERLDADPILGALLPRRIPAAA